PACPQTSGRPLSWPSVASLGWSWPVEPRRLWERYSLARRPSWCAGLRELVNAALDEPREIAGVFGLNFRLAPIEPGDRAPTGRAAAAAGHLVRLVIGHRVIGGQLLSHPNVAQRDVD